MFDDNIVLKVNFGQKILAGHLVSCRFGLSQSHSLVCISPTLDKLIVHETLAARLLSPHEPDGPDQANSMKRLKSHEPQDKEDDLMSFSSIVVGSTTTTTTPTNEPVYFISLKDVIRCLSVKRMEVPGDYLGYSKDFLLIGCSNSIVIYDAMNQTNLANLNTTTSINSISFEATPGAYNQSGQETMPTICAGSQRIYALKFDANLDVEVSSERSTSDSTTCVIQGTFNESLELLITGSSSESRKIRIYPLDSFDYNIQPCKVTLDESAGVTCLLPIYTQQVEQNDAQTSDERAARPSTTSAGGQSLPSVESSKEAVKADRKAEQMNYFAYGLENGFVGVYRLFISTGWPSSSHENQVPDTNQKLACERLWRHKSKQVPVAMLMFDVDGDGLDELVVGYKSSRLEARSAFTGQLIQSTRCFNRDRLVGLNLLHLDQRLSLRSAEQIEAKQQQQQEQQLQEAPILVACSTSGACLAFKSQNCAARRPLKGFNLSQQQQQQLGQENINRPSTRRDEQTLRMCSYANLAQSMEESQEEPSRDATNNLEARRQETTANLHIESASDNTKPVKCDSRQNVELLQRLSNLLRDSLELEDKARQVYHAQMHQVGCADEQQHHLAGSGGVCSIRHGWSFDAKKLKLRLTIVVSSLIECIDLIELEEPSRNLLAKGHLLISIPDANHCLSDDRTQVVVEQRQRRSSSLNSTAPARDLIVVVLLRSSRHDEAKLSLKVYSSNEAKSSNSRQQQVARVYNRTIRVPKFAMFAPIDELQRDKADQDDLMTCSSSSFSSTATYSKLSFKLADSLSHLQLLDWLAENFLCFQFKSRSSSLRDQQKHSALLLPSHANQQVRSRLTAMMSPTKMRVDSNQFDSRPDEQFRGQLGEDEFDLRLLDVRLTIDKLAARQPADTNDQRAECKSTSTTTTAMETSAGKSFASNGEKNENDPSSKAKHFSILRVAYLRGQLEIESENSDLLVNLVQFLVIDRLNLRLSSEGLQSGAWKANIEPILSELNAISSIRQLKESETRIQTELYESADYTKNLMQQFAIANQLNEFSTSKLLLNELSTTLSGAQNAAQAHYLNNRTRCELSKRIGLLTEKISFLTGHSSSQAV